MTDDVLMWLVRFVWLEPVAEDGGETRTSDEKQIRVSVYWFTRSLKRNRGNTFPFTLFERPSSIIILHLPLHDFQFLAS